MEVMIKMTTESKRDEKKILVKDSDKKRETERKKIGSKRFFSLLMMMLRCDEAKIYIYFAKCQGMGNFTIFRTLFSLSIR